MSDPENSSPSTEPTRPRSPQAPPSGQMHFTEVNGVRLETLHLPGAGGRAPLVFLHEGLGSVSMWTQRGRCWPTELCAASGRAGWLYSRRGYGRSDPVADVRGPSRSPGGRPHGAQSGWQSGWPTGRHTPDYMHHEAAQVLPMLWAAWGIERPVLVGHSDGATIVLLHASAQRVSGCVVMAPHLFVEPVALSAIAQARDAFLASSTSTGEPPGQDAGNGFRQRLARHHADVDNAFWQWNDVWLSEAFRGFDIRDNCRGIRDPLLALQGHDDEYGSLAQLDALQQAAPHAQRLELPACGHSPHRDQPDALTEHVLRFLAALP